MKNRRYFLLKLSLFICGVGAAVILSVNQRPAAMRVHFVDVGYGDAVVIELPDKSVMMIDAGGKEHSGRLAEFLKSLKITTIDTALITHPHKNHFEGFAELTKQFSFNKFYISPDTKGEDGYAELLEAVKKQGIPVEVVKRGFSLESSDNSWEIMILHPEKLSGNTNDNSIAAWLSYKKTSFLFMGDIGTKPQEEMLSLFPPIRNADCIQVAHHGYAISPELAHIFKGRTFVISTGEHPDRTLGEDDLKGLPGQILRTDAHGTITIKSNGNSILSNL